MSFIAKHTKRIRYKLASIMLEKLTPKLYEQFNRQTFKTDSNESVLSKDIMIFMYYL